LDLPENKNIKITCLPIGTKESWNESPKAEVD
jgi:hypothetical protein